MGLFKKKSFAERINSKWSTLTCSLDTMKRVLEEDSNLEIWMKYSSVYFQIGTASDFSKDKGFFDKTCYINLKPNEPLTPLLNGADADTGFCMRPSFDTLANEALFNGLTLHDIWPQAVIVGVAEGDPKHAAEMFGEQ